jgi:hypothetical protein
VGGVLFAILLIGNSAYAKPVVRPDPREGVLDASLVLVVRQVERDTFSAEEVFLGEMQAGDLINLTDFKLTTEQYGEPDKIDPITPDTRILLFLKKIDKGWEITQYNRCFFWTHDPNKVDELRTRAQQAVELRKEWEEARDTPDEGRRVEMLWPFLWDHGVSFLKHTQSELRKTGSVAGNYIAERLASLNHRLRMVLLHDLSECGGERLHVALRKHLRDQKELCEQFAASRNMKSISMRKDWDRLPDEIQAAPGELCYGLAGLAGFKDQSDLPFIKELAEWSIENDCSQVCYAALEAFRYMPERENLPIIVAIWERFWTKPPDGNGISPFDITRTLRAHAYPETVPLLAKFLGDENVGSEARAFLAEIVGNDLGPDIEAWLDWYNRRKGQEGKE